MDMPCPRLLPRDGIKEETFVDRKKEEKLKILAPDDRAFVLLSPEKILSSPNDLGFTFPRSLGAWPH
jgi:hypothetical protein